MFIPIYGADTDKACRAMYIDITGVTCYGAVGDVPFAKLHSPMVIEFTSPCPDYSLGNKNPKGELGDKGGAEFTKIPFFVRMTCPRVVFIEQVGNIVNFETEVIAVLMGLQHEGYVVHAALVSMQQYGDIENCWRLPVVAIHESLGQWAKAYRIPVGEFSDSVSYCAEDVATLDAKVPEKYKRFMADYSVKCKSSQPGHLQKVAQTAPGHGFSSRPNACYSASGVPPKCTTYWRWTSQASRMEGGRRARDLVHVHTSRCEQAQEPEQDGAGVLCSALLDEWTEFHALTGCILVQVSR